jgi:uncharacterized protein YjlB
MRHSSAISSLDVLRGARGGSGGGGVGLRLRRGARLLLPQSILHLMQQRSMNAATMMGRRQNGKREENGSSSLTGRSAARGNVESLCGAR